MSFGLSRGRAFDTTGYGLDLSDLPPFDRDNPAANRCDPREWFAAPDRDLEIEIGSGKGTFLVQEAPRRPLVNYLGIERAAEFYRYAADRARRHGLENVRLLHADATEFIHFRCQGAIATVIHLYFSDPWPKKRHWKRRVLQDQTLVEFHRVLLPGGEVRIVTDHPQLWEWYLERAAANETLFSRHAYVAPESAVEGEVVGTNYERKFVLEGRPFHAMTLVRRP